MNNFVNLQLDECDSKIKDDDNEEPHHYVLEFYDIVQDIDKLKKKYFGKEQIKKFIMEFKYNRHAVGTLDIICMMHDIIVKKTNVDFTIDIDYELLILLLTISDHGFCYKFYEKTNFFRDKSINIVNCLLLYGVDDEYLTKNTLDILYKNGYELDISEINVETIIIVINIVLSISTSLFDYFIEKNVDFSQYRDLIIDIQTKKILIEMCSYEKCRYFYPYLDSIYHDLLYNKITFRNIVNTHAGKSFLIDDNVDQSIEYMCNNTFLLLSYLTIYSDDDFLLKCIEYMKRNNIDFKKLLIKNFEIYSNMHSKQCVINGIIEKIINKFTHKIKWNKKDSKIIEQIIFTSFHKSDYCEHILIIAKLINMKINNQSSPDHINVQILNNNLCYEKYEDPKPVTDYFDSNEFDDIEHSDESDNNEPRSLGRSSSEDEPRSLGRSSSIESNSDKYDSDDEFDHSQYVDYSKDEIYVSDYSKQNNFPGYASFESDSDDDDDTYNASSSDESSYEFESDGDQKNTTMINDKKYSNTRNKPITLEQVVDQIAKKYIIDVKKQIVKKVNKKLKTEQTNKYSCYARKKYEYKLHKKYDSKNKKNFVYHSVLMLLIAYKKQRFDIIVDNCIDDDCLINVVYYYIKYRKNFCEYLDYIVKKDFEFFDELMEKVMSRHIDVSDTKISYFVDFYKCLKKYDDITTYDTNDFYDKLIGIHNIIIHEFLIKLSIYHNNKYVFLSIINYFKTKNVFFDCNIFFYFCDMYMYIDDDFLECILKEHTPNVDNFKIIHYYNSKFSDMKIYVYEKMIDLNININIDSINIYDRKIFHTDDPDKIENLIKKFSKYYKDTKKIRLQFFIDMLVKQLLNRNYTNAEIIMNNIPDECDLNLQKNIIHNDNRYRTYLELLTILSDNNAPQRIIDYISFIFSP
jgi:hypothetical protein